MEVQPFRLKGKNSGKGKVGRRRKTLLKRLMGANFSQVGGEDAIIPDTPILQSGCWHSVSPEHNKKNFTFLLITEHDFQVVYAVVKEPEYSGSNFDLKIALVAIHGLVSKLISFLHLQSVLLYNVLLFQTSESAWLHAARIPDIRATSDLSAELNEMFADYVLAALPVTESMRTNELICGRAWPEF